jgi:hypothetical protein
MIGVVVVFDDDALVMSVVLAMLVVFVLRQPNIANVMKATAIKSRLRIFIGDRSLS